MRNKLVMPASNDFERIFNLCMSKGGTIHLRHSIQYGDRKVWKITASVYQSGKQKLNIDGELVHNDFTAPFGLLECIVKGYSSKTGKSLNIPSPQPTRHSAGRGSRSCSAS